MIDDAELAALLAPQLGLRAFLGELDGSGAGDLLPKGQPLPPFGRQAETIGPHKFRADPADARRCRVCGLKPSVHEGRRRRRRATPVTKLNLKPSPPVRSLEGRHAGPDHAHVPTGHLRGVRTVIKSRHRATMAAHEAGMHETVTALFDAQAKSAVRWFSGKRGREMRAAATTPPPAGQAPPTVNPSAIFDTGYWATTSTQAFINAYAPIADTAVGKVNRAIGQTVTDSQAKAMVDAALRARAATVAAQITSTTYNNLAAAIGEGMGKGESTAQLSTRVRDVFHGTAGRARADMIARTEANSASNMAASGYADALPMGSLSGREWLAVHDGRTRPDHAKADGQRRPMGMPFQVGGYPLQHPGDPLAPPSETINCFIGETPVLPGGKIKTVYRRWYEGLVVKVKTSCGVEITATPNHPVLTGVGWVALQNVSVGAQLAKAVGAGRMGFSDPEVQDVVPTIEQFYHAATQLRTMQRVSGRRVDFHGDGADAEVEVVRTDGYLPAPFREHVSNALLRGLAGRISDGFDLSGAEMVGVADDVCRGVVAPNGRRHSGGQGLALLERHGGQTGVEGLATVADRNARFDQKSVHGASTDAQVTGDGGFALPVEITFDDVISVEFIPFAGHVYNLSTEEEWYSASTIIAHNCRCTLLYLPAAQSHLLVATAEHRAAFDELEYRVGPKGFAHGWVFVGVPDVGSTHTAPGGGEGTVTKVSKNQFGHQVHMQWSDGSITKHKVIPSEQHAAFVHPDDAPKVEKVVHEGKAADGSALQVGDKVAHPEHGSGTVTNLLPNEAVVKLDKGGYKHVKPGTLNHIGVVPKAEPKLPEPSPTPLKLEPKLPEPAKVEAATPTLSTILPPSKT